jgi:hypothetical protein
MRLEQRQAIIKRQPDFANDYQNLGIPYKKMDEGIRLS